MNRIAVRNIAVALLLLLAVGTGAWWLTRPALGTPDESRRVRHPRGGFSIIAPSGWGAQPFYETPGQARSGDGITFRPDNTRGRVSTFTVTRYTAPPDPAELRAAGYLDAILQGRPALRLWKRGKYEWIVFTTFERDGNWYALRLSTPKSEDVSGSPWRAFLESFRVEPRVALPTSGNILATPTLTPMGPELPAEVPGETPGDRPINLPATTAPTGPLTPTPVPSH